MSEVKFLKALNYDVFARLRLILNEVSSEPQEFMIRESAKEAALSLAVEASGLVQNHEISNRIGESKVLQSPFWKLVKQAGHFVEGEGEANLYIDLLLQVELCRRSIGQIMNQLDDRGVSVNLVYRIDRLNKILNRIEALVHILSAGNNLEANERLGQFIAELVRAHQEDTSIRKILSNNLRLLAKRITERAGHSGEHYIASSASDWWAMVLAGCGGGVITAIAAMGKIQVTHRHFPLFFEGFFNFLIYAASFILIQICGFALATKQPAMTAATLATRLRSKKESDNNKFIEEVVLVSRSQFASMLGNVAFVIPSAYVIFYLLKSKWDFTVIDPEYSQKVISGLDPIESGTIYFAFLTGILLWLASVIGGWIENWTVYERLPEALARSPRLRSIFGSKLCERMESFFSENISGFGTSIALAFGLAYAPIYGKFIGLDLDTRHITLATGTLTFSLLSVGEGVPVEALKFASIGLCIVAFFNFTVSFTLAIIVAARSQDVRMRQLFSIFRQVIVRFILAPWKFFLPV